jgi:hypothetical protein
MSFDLYFEPATQGKPLAISRAELRSLFPIVEEESEPDYWKIRYDPHNVCHIGVKTSKPPAIRSHPSMLKDRAAPRACGKHCFKSSIRVRSCCTFLEARPSWRMTKSQRRGLKTPAFRWANRDAWIRPPRFLKSSARIRASPRFRGRLTSPAVTFSS